MIQQFLSKHTYPYNQEGLVFDGYKVTALASASLSPASACCHLDLPAVAEPSVFALTVPLDGINMGTIPRAIGVSGSYRCGPTTIAYLAYQLVPVGAPVAFDASKPATLYPIHMNIGVNALSFKDVISVPPSPDPYELVPAVSLLLVLRDGDSILGAGGLSHVVSDGPVYQPNK